MALARDWLIPPLLYALVLIFIAMIGGGWLALGRVDPLLAVPGAGWAAVAAAWTMRGRPPAWVLEVAAGAGATILGAIMLFDGMDGVRGVELTIALIALVASALITTAVTHGGMRLADQRRWAQRLLLVAGLPMWALAWSTLAWPMVENAYRIEAGTDQRPRVAWLTSLPMAFPATIGLRPGQSQAGRDSADDPVSLFLSQTTRQRLLVSIDAAALADVDVLLLAHPPSLDPAQLVSIDDWVRGGGRAVVLADALSSWPQPYPLGDPHNPPVTSLLGPLLTHWGVTLDAPRGLAESRQIIRDSGQRLDMVSAGRFRAVKTGCRVLAQGIVGDCRVGLGQVVLVADADLLNPALWAGTGSGDGMASWSSGNMLWLHDKLLGNSIDSAPFALARPSWSRSRIALVDQFAP